VYGYSGLHNIALKEVTTCQPQVDTGHGRLLSRVNDGLTSATGACLVVSTTG